MYVSGIGPWGWAETEGFATRAFLAVSYAACLCTLSGLAFMLGFNAGTANLTYWRERALIAERKNSDPTA